MGRREEGHEVKLKHVTHTSSRAVDTVSESTHALSGPGASTPLRGPAMLLSICGVNNSFNELQYLQ